MLTGLTEANIEDKNKDLIKKFEKDINSSRDKNKKLFDELETKMYVSYTITVILYISMFILGVVLLLVPILAAFYGVTSLNSFFSGTLGIADLIVLLLFRPVEKIHNNMSDLSQLSIILNSYQQQLSLRLLELDVNNRYSLGKTASNLNMTTTSIVKLIQEYTETNDKYTTIGESTATGATGESTATGATGEFTATGATGESTATGGKPAETTSQNNQNELVDQILKKIEDLIKGKPTKEDNKKTQ